MKARKTATLVLLSLIVLLSAGKSYADEIFSMKFKADERKDFLFTQRNLALKLHPTTPGGENDGFVITREGDPKLYFLGEKDFLVLTRNCRYIISAARAYLLPDNRGLLIGNFQRIKDLCNKGPIGQWYLKPIDFAINKIYAQLSPPSVTPISIPNFYEVKPQPLMPLWLKALPSNQSYNTFCQVDLAARPLMGIMEMVYETEDNIVMVPDEYKRAFVRYGVQIGEVKYVSFGAQIDQ